jgi:lipopolysaccharide/colanic/teichoic acid biosynthesis glycosyltransferase
MKRTLDIAAAIIAAVLLAPVLVVIAIAVWLEDRSSPWFGGIRIGKDGVEFRMLKFRTMRPDAWKTGVNSTAAGDPRITRAGKWLRRSKIDEIPQLWNVLKGDMSLVGPRPQVRADASLYTEEEKKMLSVRPGITDLASIVFADEGDILAGSADPDLLYNQVIRPWKSRLALDYVRHASFTIDLRILMLTILNVFSRRRALEGVARILEEWGACAELRKVVLRDAPLRPYPPPGAETVVARYAASSASSS